MLKTCLPFGAIGKRPVSPSRRKIGRAHDDLHTGLDYIDEVARILVDAAMHYDDPNFRLSESRLWFLAHAVEEAAGGARAAARQLPGSPYNLDESGD
jgi:hypothetical protein